MPCVFHNTLMKQDNNYPHHGTVLQKLVYTPLMKEMTKLKNQREKETEKYIYQPHEILLACAVWLNRVIPTRLGCFGRWKTKWASSACNDTYIK